MATSLLSDFIGAAKWKIVNEKYGVPLWTGVGVASVDTSTEAQITNQPLSTKDLTNDSVYEDLLVVDTKNSKILRPVVMRLSIFVKDVSTLENISSAFADTTSTFSITSKSIVSDYMLLKSVNISHDNDMLSASKVVLEFEQWTPENTVTFNPDGTYNATNYGIRIQSLSSVSVGQISSTVNSLTTAAEALYSKVSNVITG